MSSPVGTADTQTGPMTASGWGYQHLLGAPGHSRTSAHTDFTVEMHMGTTPTPASLSLATPPRRATVLTHRTSTGPRAQANETRTARGCLSDAAYQGMSLRSVHTQDRRLSHLCQEISLLPRCWCERLVNISAHVETPQDQKPPLQPEAPGNSSWGPCADDHSCLPGSLWDRPGTVRCLVGSTQAPQQRRPSC